MLPFAGRLSFRRSRWSRPPRLAIAVSLVVLLSSVLPTAQVGLAPQSVLASHTPNPTSVTVAGSLDSEIGCPGDWQPDCAAAHLAYDASDDVWQGTLSPGAGSYEYKAALNNSWDENYGLHAAPGGANIPLAAPAGPVKFYYDHKTHWVTDNVSSVIATAPGSYQSELGCPGDWQPDCLRSWLQDPDGDGIYTFETTSLPAGTYEAKAAINESWDENYGSGGVPGGPNISFNVPLDFAKVTFSYNASSHLLSILAGHGHDNNVEWDGLRHDSRDTLYRTPGGAVPAGTPVTLRFRTFASDVTGVSVRFFSLRLQGQQVVPMSLAASDVGCYQASLASEACDYWQLTLPASIASQPDNLWYRFIVTDGTDTDYYADDTAALDGGLGRATDEAVDQSWALMQYVPGFTAPSWASDAVIYQVFPDRFRNGRKDNDPKTGDPRYDQPVLKLPWGTLPEGYCRNYADASVNCVNRFDPNATGTEQPLGRDYMGGDLKGVDQQLSYLVSLGVNTLYFNPIFDAASNHSYDTQDYRKVDPYFGTQKDWDNLAKHARQLGVRIILDGVFNHVSSDSPLFDRYGHFSTVGACESPSSPYRSWFRFTDVPAGSGPCTGSTGTPHAARYEAWFGFDSLPVLEKSQPDLQAYFLTAPDSVARHWILSGASGWRLDVAGDASFPNGYWESFRSVVKAANPDALTITESWQKDSTLLRMLRGDRLDTTMDYRLRDAVLGFLAPQAFDAKGFPDSGTSIEPSVFTSRLASIREDYPDAAYYSLMNLLDSHDTERLLWTLTPGSETTADKELNSANVAAGKARVRLASLIQFTLPGAPTIYYGDEVGVTGDDDPDDRRTYPWSDLGGSPDMALFAHYQALAALRRDIPALTDGDFKVLLADDAAEVAAYGRRTDTDAAVIVVNRSASPQTVHVPLAGYLRDGVTFSQRYPAGGSVASAGGELVVTVPALGGLLLATGPGQDLAGPAAPTSLVAAAGNGRVDLGWAGGAGASSYAVYRSPVSGGGFVSLGTTPGTTFTDTTVRNGTRYFYVVRALDALGNEGPASNEAAATPSFPIGYAVLQWPKEITITRGETTPTTYGQVYVAGLTDAGAPSSAILAQVGFGIQGSDPAGWSTWRAMGFNLRTGNNFEYQGTLRPATAGVFDLLVRFSTDNGLTWTYGDQDGFFPGESGTDQPGVLTVNPSDDATAPAAPSDLDVTDWGAAFIELGWTAPADPDVAEYGIYRDGGSGFEQIASVPVTPAQPTYRDESVVAGTTYTYRVTAFDGSLNESPPSNEVSHAAEPKLVNVTFRVRVPDSTPPGDTVFLPGNIDQLGPWNPGKQAMTPTGTPGIWEVTLPILDGTELQYKYTRGTWDQVEWWGSIVDVANRFATIGYGTTGEQLVDDTSTDWDNAAIPDGDKAVRYWRDPLVMSASGDSSGAVITFERDIQPSGADFANAVSVTHGGTVAGSVAETSPGVLTWTPAASLAAGTYSVTVFNVRSYVNGDSVPMQAPYVFSFTVG